MKNVKHIILALALVLLAILGYDYTLQRLFKGRAIVHKHYYKPQDTLKQRQDQL